MNGIVDAADYNVWRDSLGSTMEFAADGNQSGTIDVGDYDVWKTNFGQHAPGAGSGSADFGELSRAGASPSRAAVPEPYTSTLVFLALLFTAGRTRLRS